MSTIDTAIQEYLFAKKMPVTAKTYRWYKQKLIVLSAWCAANNISQLGDLKASEIRRFLHSLTERTPPLSSYTRRGYTQVTKQFLHWCAIEEDFEQEVNTKTSERIEYPKIDKTVIVPFSNYEIDQILAACDKEDTKPLQARAKAIIYLLLDTGIRVSELAFDTTRPEETTGLRVDKTFLDPSDPFIRVMGKGRKERDITMGQKSRMFLRKYMRYRNGSSSPYLFLTRSGEPLSVRGVEALVTRLGERAHVSDCFVHRFRHTFAHQYHLVNKNIHELSLILGHTSVKVTENYLQKFAWRGKYSVADNLE